VFGRNCEKIDFETTTAMMYCNLHREHCMIKWKYIYIYILCGKRERNRTVENGFYLLCFIFILFYYKRRGDVVGAVFLLLFFFFYFISSSNLFIICIYVLYFMSCGISSQSFFLPLEITPNSSSFSGGILRSIINL
jgi:hypothetical protein